MSERDHQKMYDFSILRELRKREGLSIADVSERSGVSTAVISKLERNQTVAELETIYRLGRVYGMNPSDLIALSENRSAHKVSATEYRSDGFHFQRVQYGNVRCLLGRGKAGSRAAKPQVHRDDFELCWVLKGELGFQLPNETYSLKAGEAIQFDALLEHSYEALADCEVLLVHLRKGKRF